MEKTRVTLHEDGINCVVAVPREPQFKGLPSSVAAGHGVVVTGSEDGTIAVARLRSGKLSVLARSAALPAGVTCVAYQPHAGLIAAGCGSNAISVYELGAGSAATATAAADDAAGAGPVAAAAKAPAVTLSLLHTASIHGDEPSALSFHADADVPLLASVDDDGALAISHARTGRLLALRRDAHHPAAACVAFRPGLHARRRVGAVCTGCGVLAAPSASDAPADAVHLLTGGFDQSVVQWEVAPLWGPPPVDASSSTVTAGATSDAAPTAASAGAAAADKREDDHDDDDDAMLSGLVAGSGGKGKAGGSKGGKGGKRKAAAKAGSATPAGSTDSSPTSPDDGGDASAAASAASSGTETMVGPAPAGTHPWAEVPPGATAPFRQLVGVQLLPIRRWGPSTMAASTFLHSPAASDGAADASASIGTWACTGCADAAASDGSTTVRTAGAAKPTKSRKKPSASSADAAAAEALEPRVWEVCRAAPLSAREQARARLASKTSRAKKPAPRAGGAGTATAAAEAAAAAIAGKEWEPLAGDPPTGSAATTGASGAIWRLRGIEEDEWAAMQAAGGVADAASGCGGAGASDGKLLNPAFVYALAVVPGGATAAVSPRDVVLAARGDGCVAAYDIDTGMRICKWDAHGTAATVVAATHAAGGLLVCTSGNDKHAKVWRVDPATMMPQEEAQVPPVAAATVLVAPVVASAAAAGAEADAPAPSGSAPAPAVDYAHTRGLNGAALLPSAEAGAVASGGVGCAVLLVDSTKVLTALRA